MPDLKSLLGDSKSNYGDLMKSLYRDVSIAVIAQVQQSKDRNKRIMGARRSMTGNQLQKYLDRADNVRRKCSTIRQIKYKPIIISALRLLDHYQKISDQAKVDKIRKGLVHIRIIYNTFFIIEEAANECYDQVYDQVEMLAVQGFNPPDGEEDDEEDYEGGKRPKRIAIDDRRADRDRRRRYAKEEEARTISRERENPDAFDDALKDAAREAFGKDFEEEEQEEVNEDESEEGGE